MKILIILLITTSFLYSYYDYDDYLRNQNILENKKINLEHQKYLDEKKEAKKRRHKIDIENRNHKARQANDKYYRDLKNKNMRNKYNNRYSTPKIKKTYNPKYFKNRPQIILDELHILGIKSIKQCKQDKYIIKAVNGTFALPKDKFKKAEKINFNSKELKQYL